LNPKKNLTDKKPVSDGTSFEDFAKDFLAKASKSKKYFLENSEKLIDGQKKGDLYSQFIRYTSGAVSNYDEEKITM